MRYVIAIFVRSDIYIAVVVVAVEEMEEMVRIAVLLMLQSTLITGAGSRMM